MLKIKIEKYNAITIPNKNKLKKYIVYYTYTNKQNILEILLNLCYSIIIIILKLKILKILTISTNGLKFMYRRINRIEKLIIQKQLDFK